MEVEGSRIGQVGEGVRVEGKAKEGGERQKALWRLLGFTPGILDNSTSVSEQHSTGPGALRGNTRRDHWLSFAVPPCRPIRPSVITDHSQSHAASRGECP